MPFPLVIHPNHLRFKEWRDMVERGEAIVSQPLDFRKDLAPGREVTSPLASSEVKEE